MLSKLFAALVPKRHSSHRVISQVQMATAEWEVIGGKQNFWLYSKEKGFDLTHPPTPDASPIYPRIRLETTTKPVDIDPAKSALVVVDLQNYLLSPALGRPREGPGMDAVHQLVKLAIPACRQAGILIVWLGWGVTDDDIDGMPPTILKGLGADINFDSTPQWPVGKLGKDIGRVKLEDGSDIEGGKILKPGEWNSEFYEPLAEQARPEDCSVNKNRLNGFWGGTSIEKTLDSRGIRTLFFAGCNTDQCVAGSLQDAFTKGYDCLMLSDGCGTWSPDFARRCIEYNTEAGWGFLLSCQQFIDGVQDMRKAPKSNDDPTVQESSNTYHL